MRTEEKFETFKKSLILGLEKTFENLIKFKKEKNSVLVIMQGDKIVKIKPV